MDGGEERLASHHRRTQHVGTRCISFFIFLFWSGDGRGAAFSVSVANMGCDSGHCRTIP